MSFDPTIILKEVDSTKKKIENTLKVLAQASRERNMPLYKKKHSELFEHMNTMENVLNRANSVPDDLLRQHQHLNFTKKVSDAMEYVEGIPDRIPPKPDGGNFDGGESAPLIGDDYDEGHLRDQSNLVIQAHRDETQEIEGIVDRMKDLNVAFTKVHALVEEQQTHIDNIVANVEEADENIEEGVQQIDKAQTYQKKSSKKLIIMLAIAGVGAFLLVVGIAIFLLITFLPKDKEK